MHLLDIYIIYRSDPSFQQLVRDLGRCDSVTATVIGTHPSPDRGGWNKAWDVPPFVVRTWRGMTGADVVSLHASIARLQIYGPLLVWLCRVTRKPLILRAG